MGMKNLIIIPFLLMPHSLWAKDLFSKKEKQVASLLKSDSRFIELRKKHIALESKRRMSYFLLHMTNGQKDLLEHQISKGVWKFLDKIDRQEAFEKQLKKLIYRGLKEH